MTHIAFLEGQISAYEDYITMMRKELSANEEHLYNLNIQLQEEWENLKPVGTKFKWVKDNNYRVAVVTKKGVLQVKSVTDGVADEVQCPEYDGCSLEKTFFASESEWRKSLPEGEISTTFTDRSLKELSCKPLTGTDPDKLKELEERFPGGVFVVSTNKQTEVQYSYNCIFGRNDSLARTSFKDFGHKPRLMVEWNGLSISLSHLI